LPLVRPNRPAERRPRPTKAFGKAWEQADLARVAAGANYEPSPYHCRGPDGERPRFRIKPATPCPHDWTVPDAEQVLRQAIRNGFVSEARSGDFPRFVWYREGDNTIYEATNENATPERYHAYPVEQFEVPQALGW